ncbi:MAG: ribose 5-phosphate isomerase B [Candidatus Omnitrophica bacterium]|nr:ribose 5-phosphate isomerase B [Candidatus Omnitrophota bacterium]
MKIFIGSDHRGFALKQKIGAMLNDMKLPVVDVGTDREDVPCDYPKIAYEVSQNVAKSKNSRGILVCMSGIGHSIAANKVRGVYAALCYNKEAAVLSRQHNNSNVLVVGSKFVSENDIYEMVKIWLAEEFEGGRHLRRVDQIKAIEQENFK